MHDQNLTTSHHQELLESLKAHRFLADYRLAVYTRHDDCGGSGAHRWHFLESTPCSSLCAASCTPGLARSLNAVRDNDREMLFNCPAGLPAFVLPLPSGPAAPPAFLVGCGVRDQSLDLLRLQDVAATADLDPLDLLVRLESLPVATRNQFEETARQVSGLIALLPGTTASAFMAKTTGRTGAVVGVAADIDRAETAEGAVCILSEAIGILFDIPGIAVARAAEDDDHFLLRGTWGHPVAEAKFPSSDMTRLFASSPTAAVCLEEEQCEEYFPGVQAGNAICLPLAAGEDLHGLVGLFNTGLKGNDLHLVELLVGRVATRLAQLEKDEEQRRRNAVRERYFGMITTLALIDETEALYRGIVEMAAELVLATCGSLMLLKEDGETLTIEAAIGMNPSLARSLSTRIGTGIAGRVAASGHPLLVNDIEKDTRLASLNRPRFKTKSFICLPLRFKERTIGVLNLSDKEHQGIYTEKDLETLLPFVEHASVLVERARSLARTGILERLSVTDPLTELFNRRFLEKRLEEELNRAKRHGLQLTLMMIDLDGFKAYNDLHGHLAGDKALKKTARVLRASVRDMDVVTRYGGEEFCIVLPDTAKKESHFVADRIRRGIEKEPFPGEESLPSGRLTASIGISSFPEDGDTPASLTRAADVALYEAKSGGRNRIVFCSTSTGGTRDRENSDDKIKRA